MSVLALSISGTIIALVSGYLLWTNAGKKKTIHNLQEHSASERVDLLNLQSKVESIKWFTELLQSDEYGKLKLSQKEFISEITKSTTDAISIVRRLIEQSSAKSDLAADATKSMEHEAAS